MNLKRMLETQAARRKANAAKPPHDNSKDYAGSPMIFACLDCGDDIILARRRIISVRCPDCALLASLREMESKE